MSAGESAGQEAQRQLKLAELHTQAAAEAREAAARYSVAAVTEKSTARTLAPLAAVGYHLLPDRRWPGTRRAQVDLVVVGPGGVFIVDTKAWTEVSIVLGRVFRGQEDVTDDLGSLLDLAETARDDLANIGLAPGEVRVHVVLAGRSGVDQHVNGLRIVGEREVLRAISSYGNRLSPAQVDQVLARILGLFQQLDVPPPVVARVPEPVLPAPPHELEQDALLSEDEVNAALLEGMFAAPIEEWMAFLHPHQARTVRRSFSGPARVRGPAGTGKTVVGLHRAAYLARTRPGRILVTTFVRTLPAVLGSLITRLAPEIVDRVEFAGIHGFAHQLLRERGVSVRVDREAIDQAFEAAWTAAEAETLGSHAEDRLYWREEIEYVLKGRGLTSYRQYADLPRTGRRRALQLSQRRAVWALYERYQAELRRRRCHDWADIILLAEQELSREPPKEPYAAVIVDEAQDLSCAMVRMLHGLVGDVPDGLTLIGDGQQSIYPGGYSLAEAGISIAGRGVVLDVNYRNTAQIVSFASRLVDGDEYADIEGAIARGDTPSSVPRSGPAPVVHRYLNFVDRDAAMVERVREVTALVGTGIGDVGVLCSSRKAVGTAARVLQAVGIPTVDLEHYDGKPIEAVKVGTIKRAKGLEFKQVLLPDISPRLTGHNPPADPAELEHWQLARRELYVAMTRARDGLWLAIR